MEILVLIIVIGLAVLFLKGFDRASDQSPKQVSDGIKLVKIPPAKRINPLAVLGHPEKYSLRIPCPSCAEQILPLLTVCPFCKFQLKD